MRKIHILSTAAALTTLLVSAGAFAQDNPATPKPLPNQKQEAAPSPKTTGEGVCPTGQEANCKKPATAAEPAVQPKPKGQATEEATPPKRPKAAEGETPAKPKVGQQELQQPQAPKAAEGQTPAKPKVGQQELQQPQSPKAAAGQDTAEPGKPKKPMTGSAAPEQVPANNGAPTKTEAAQGQTPAKTTDVEVTGSLNIGREKAARVSDTLFRSGERVDIDVSVSVGMALPERVRPRPLPTSIVEIAPEYRGYDYVIIRDEIVIVEPSTRKVVEIIHHRGGQQARASSGLRLSAAQREKIREYARQQHIVSTQERITVDAGAKVPDSVTLVPLPDTVVTEVPEARSYQFFMDSDQVVLVDPQTREVVETVE